MNENGFNNTRATIKDVAVKANVSLSTVSRALREPDKTPAETVSKVRAAAEALNYVYNATAGSLSKRRSDTIGILLPSPTYAAFGVNLMAIQKTCSERNYSCKVALSQFSPEEERLAMRRFHEQRIGGLILVGLRHGVPHRRSARDRRADENAGGGGHPLHHPVGSAGRKRELYRHRQRAVHLYERQIPH